MEETKMKGLFNTTQTQSSTISGGKILTCVSCGLLHNTKNRFKPYGLGEKGIMIIGDAPTNKEDELKKPFLSNNARILRSHLERQGIDLYKDCYSLYACSCACIDKIPNYSVEACRKNVIKYIKELKPKVVIALGVEALVSIIGDKYKENIESVEKWRKWTIPNYDWNCYICATYHYRDLEEDEIGQLLFEQDLTKYISLPKHLPKQEKPNVQIIEDLTILNTITSELISIDYETTGIKPHAKGHRIVCASVAYDENNCYAFMLPSNRAELQPLIDLLINPNIRKMAHNMKFEHSWTMERLRVEIQNWYFDSMIAAHILDNRFGICGLKFLAFVMLGVGDYSSEVSEYLQSSGKSDNELNKVLEYSIINKEKLLTYCGLDTIYQYRIALKQMEEMGI
jgi:uracil-DNA glycosylase family 4